ncbi:MAG: glycosyltransferase [bacterium]|nr:glycosyltransferase [bacterium]
MDLSVIMPIYNGRNLLEKNLDPLLKELSEIKQSELIIIDDYSSDGSFEYVKKNFRDKIILLKNETNQGFSKTVNAGIKISKGKYILLINSDIEIKDHFILKLIDEFEKNTFACVPSIVLDEKENIEEGFSVFSLTPGFFSIDNPNIESFEYNINETITIPHACAACALYSGEKLKQLNGFNERYSPFFWEDVDLSLRALQNGWEIKYNPFLKVFHDKSKTINNFYNKNDSFIISLKNKIILNWYFLRTSEERFLNYLYLKNIFEIALEENDKELLISLNIVLDIYDEVRKESEINLNIPLKDLEERYGYERYKKYKKE